MTNEQRDEAPNPADLPRLVARAKNQRIAWTSTSQDLNVNLIVLQRDERIENHRNDEVDVLIIGIEGTGEISIDGATARITPDTAIIMALGAERGLLALTSPFAYLTCHRQRRQLWPTTQSRQSSAS